jgi:hypothetical protein
MLLRPCDADWDSGVVAQIDRRYLTASPRKTLVRLLSYGLFEGRPLATRGRWINPLVLALGRYFTRHPARRMIEAPIFIMGQGRSGTTVLGKVLSLHPKIGFLNEPKALWHIAHPHEDLIGNFTDEPARYILTDNEVTASIASRLRRLYSGYLWLTGTARILDKYPELLFRVSFIRKIFPDARYLLLARNGQAVCRSVENWSRIHARIMSNASVDWWGRNDRKWHCLIDDLVDAEPDLRIHREELRTLQRQRDRAALEWVLTMRAIERVMRRYPDQTLLIRYEHLTQDPATNIAGILHFCDLENDERLLRYAGETLREPSPIQTTELHESVREPFEAMMQSFDYA